MGKPLFLGILLDISRRFFSRFISELISISWRIAFRIHSRFSARQSFWYFSRNTDFHPVYFLRTLSVFFQVSLPQFFPGLLPDISCDFFRNFNRNSVLERKWKFLLRIFPKLFQRFLLELSREFSKFFFHETPPEILLKISSEIITYIPHKILLNKYHGTIS